jgi:hypothetical protein
MTTTVFAHEFGDQARHCETTDYRLSVEICEGAECAQQEGFAVHHKKNWLSSQLLCCNLSARYFLNTSTTRNYLTMTASPNILANSWKRHYEQHPMKAQSNAKLADISSILARDTAIDAGVPELCKSDYLSGM